MIPLTSSEIRRLIALLGLLGSDHHGERANAGALATRILRTKGLQWADLICPAIAFTPPPLPEPERPYAWRKQALRCMGDADRLTVWEREFLASILDRGRQRLPTARQLEVLDAISANLIRRGRQ